MLVIVEDRYVQPFAQLALDGEALGRLDVLEVDATALSGRGGVAPTSVDAEAPLQRMVDAIKAGRLDGLLPFDRRGDPVRFG